MESKYTVQNTSKTKTGFEKINKIGGFLARCVKKKKTIKILKQLGIKSVHYYNTYKTLIFINSHLF